jgi:AcrR family transcriptional regulator
MQVVPTPRRQLEHGGYARGEETRARIVATALRVFGQYGYEQASTRLIAAQARVNPPALQYYFGGKEGLHRACAQFIIDRARLTLTPALANARHALTARNRRAATEALCHVLDALVDALATDGSDSWSRFIARGKADGAGPAIQMIRQCIGRPLVQTVSKLIGLASASGGQRRLNRLRALLLLAPVNWLHANRESALTMMNWPDFDAGRRNLLKATLRAQTRQAMRVVVRRGRAAR